MGRGLSGTWVGVCEWVYVTGGVGWLTRCG